MNVEKMIELTVKFSYGMVRYDYKIIGLELQP